MKPKFSVIVPNYNYCRFLPERLKSILSQTFQDMEIILLDDCSTDGSQALLSAYKMHPKVTHIVFNQQNSGSPFAQWQKGIDLAEGEYIWIAESDDSCSYTLLSTLVDALDQHPTAAYAFSGALRIDEQGAPLSEEFDYWHQHEDGSVHCFDSQTYLQRVLFWRCSVYNASGVLFRRSVALRIPPVYAQLRYCADWLFWVEMTLQGNVVEVRQKLNRFRKHAASVTVCSDKTEARFKEYLIIHRRLFSLPFLSCFSRRLARGAFYKEVSRMFPDSDSRQAHLTRLREELGVQRADYLLERCVKTLCQLFGTMYHR